MVFLRALLLPLTLLYSIAIWFRNRMFDLDILSQHEFDIPVFIVGNITVGGTGKTPHTEYMINCLKDKYEVAVLSRGYKRKLHGLHVVETTSLATDVGDEPKQMKQKFPEISVVVDKDRVNAINKLQSGELGCNPNVIILDDAFQYRFVKASLSILLIDYNRQLDEDHLLPYGRLREPEHEKRRANIVIITKIPKDIKPIERRIIRKRLRLFPYQNLYFTYLKYGNLTPLFDNIELKETDILEKRIYTTVLLFTGIANSAPLYDYVKSLFGSVEHIKYNDHYNYILKDTNTIKTTFDKIDNVNKIIITTEKDAVKLIDIQGFSDLGLPIFFIPIKIEFIEDGAAKFEHQIASYVSNNKKSTINIH